jgi:hypothetical protein
MLGVKEKQNGHKPGLMTRVRAWLLGVEPEAFVGIQTLLSGYKGSRHKGNSMIMGGPTAWQWHATIDDTHHGVRTLENAHAHGDLSGVGPDDHHDAFTEANHTAIGDGAPHHARQHDMDSGDDHGAGVQGDILRAIAAGAWARLAVGTNGQVLTVVGGLPNWADAPAVAEHGNEKHDPNFYAVDGTEVLTAPLSMQLMAPGSEPDAVVGNEGKLYYLTPGVDDEGLLKQIMKNSTGAFEQVQIGIST